MEHTIAAISTSTMSSGGISIVRMSGKDAIEMADKIFVSKNGKKLSEASSHTVHIQERMLWKLTVMEEFL